jgi:hypothetical protein
VVEILAEDAALDALLEVLVGGGDHAHVHLHRRLAADAVELAFREHAQQALSAAASTCRRSRRGTACRLGLLEAAAALRVGAGERSLLVTEQLGLEQLRRDGGGIQRDERLGLARAVFVQARATSSLPVPDSR